MALECDMPKIDGVAYAFCSLNKSEYGWWRIDCYVLFDKTHWVSKTDGKRESRIIKTPIGDVSFMSATNVHWTLSIESQHRAPMHKVFDAYQSFYAWLETDDAKRIVGLYSKKYMKMKKRVDEIYKLIEMEQEGRKMNGKEREKMQSLQDVLAEMEVEKLLM
jgi:hypothetical protein